MTTQNWRQGIVDDNRARRADTAQGGTICTANNRKEAAHYGWLSASDHQHTASVKRKKRPYIVKGNRKPAGELICTHL